MGSMWQNFHYHILCHREGLIPWRSTLCQQGKRQVVRVIEDKMDCHVSHLCSLLAWTITMKK